MHFRILEMIAISGFLTALECTKFVFGRSSALHPAGGDYSAPQTPIAGLRGTTSKGRKGEGRRGQGKVERRTGDGKRVERKEAEEPVPFANSWIHNCTRSEYMTSHNSELLLYLNRTVDDFLNKLFVGLSCALWKNGGSDPDAVWHHRSDGSRYEALSGVWRSVYGLSLIHI